MAKKGEMVQKKEKTNLPVSEKKAGIEKILVENFVSLQKVMTNLAVKFDNLSSQISKLLELFEISAKTLAEKDYTAGEKKITDKLNNLLDQNKVIARGVALLHERENPKETEQMMAPPVQHMEKMPEPLPKPKQELPKPIPGQSNQKFKSMAM